ncbi:MAG: hypothetical protein V1494_01860 [Candidatus Diapherotrites archaeon]
MNGSSHPTENARASFMGCPDMCSIKWDTSWRKTLLKTHLFLFIISSGIKVTPQAVHAIPPVNSLSSTYSFLGTTKILEKSSLLEIFFADSPCAASILFVAFISCVMRSEYFSASFCQSFPLKPSKRSVRRRKLILLAINMLA